MKFVDAHLHMADSKFSGYDMKGASLLFSCTAVRSEWTVQKILAETDDRIVPFYGVHPWYVSDGLEGLEELLESDKRAGVGEIGLDANRDNLLMQTVSFELQMKVASDYGRNVSIHIMKTEKETLNVLSKFPPKNAILHSFSSESYVKPFSELGCYFSISPRILSKSNEKIRSLIEKIPEDRLLLETDFPGCEGNIPALAEKLSQICGKTADEIISLTSYNAERLIL